MVRSVVMVVSLLSRETRAYAVHGRAEVARRKVKSDAGEFIGGEPPAPWRPVRVCPPAPVAPGERLYQLKMAFSVAEGRITEDILSASGW